MRRRFHPCRRAESANPSFCDVPQRGVEAVVGGDRQQIDGGLRLRDRGSRVDSEYPCPLKHRERPPPAGDVARQPSPLSVRSAAARKNTAATGIWRRSGRILAGGVAGVGAADFNGDGVPDLIWMNSSTRQVTVNYFGGAGGATYQGWNWLNQGGAPGCALVNR